jgi:hypothetical protein
VTTVCARFPHITWPSSEPLLHGLKFVSQALSGGEWESSISQVYLCCPVYCHPLSFAHPDWTYLIWDQEAEVSACCLAQWSCIHHRPASFEAAGTCITFQGFVIWDITLWALSFLCKVSWHESCLEPSFIHPAIHPSTQKSRRVPILGEESKGRLPWVRPHPPSSPLLPPSSLP